MGNGGSLYIKDKMVKATYGPICGYPLAVIFYFNLLVD